MAAVGLRELLPIEDLNVCPHALVADAAIFMTRHQMISGLVETCAHFSDKAGHHHGVHVRVGDEESMHDVGAGDAENDGSIGRNDDAGRGERILLRDDANDHGAVRPDFRSKVLLEEFPGKVKPARIDRFDVRRRLCDQVRAGEDDHSEHEPDNARDDVCPSPFRPFDHLMREGAHPTSPRGRKMK